MKWLSSKENTLLLISVRCYYGRLYSSKAKVSMKCSRQTGTAYANQNQASLVSFGHASKIEKKIFAFLGYQDQQTTPDALHILTSKLPSALNVIPQGFVLFLFSFFFLFFFCITNNLQNDVRQSLVVKTKTITTLEVKLSVEGRQTQNKVHKIIQQVSYILSPNPNPPQNPCELHYGNTVSLYWQSKEKLKH